MNQQKLGTFIREERKKKHWSQKQFAELLHVSSAAVCKWETGVNIPDITNLEAISEALGISLYELINGEKFSFPVSAASMDNAHSV